MIYQEQIYKALMSFILTNPVVRGYQYWLTSFSFKRKQPLRALAKLSIHQQLGSEEACFLYFRLGMYKAVIEHPYKGSGWRGNFSKAVAYAAVGEKEHALKIIKNLRDDLKISNAFIVKLAIELSPYLPNISLCLVEAIPVKVAFKLALLIALNQLDEARELIESNEYSDIQSHFYRLNLEKDTIKKVDCLNHIFSYYQLDCVQLIDSSSSLCAHNIKSIAEDCDFQGPLVSILVTAHNSSEFIHTALKSLLRQSYQNIEIIVIDDASTDDTVEVIRSYAQNDLRIKLIELETNVGTFIAKTRGLEVANGEFVTCHDSDDWAHPRKIEMQVEPLLQDQKLIFTTSQWIRIQDDGALYARKIYPALRLNPASPMFRKDIVLEKAGCWDQVRTGADSEFLERLKIIFGEQVMHQIKKPLTIGSHRSGSLMTDTVTGYSSLEGTQQRLEYWESWQKKHLHDVQKMML